MKKVLVLFMVSILVLLPILSYAVDYSSMTIEELNVELELINEEIAKRKASYIAKAPVGSIVTFGRYEQDDNMENGKEEIEWVVLDVQVGKALLLSRYGLHTKVYNEEKTEITWEKCTLRQWLNTEFLQEAFSESERSAILLTNVDNRDGQKFSDFPWADKTTGGNDTQDYVYLLSYLEAHNYLNVVFQDDSNMASRATPTTFAVMYGAKINEDYLTEDGEPVGWWWLRSPGAMQMTAAEVYGNGSVAYSNVDYAGGIVRPVIWVDLESDYFK